MSRYAGQFSLPEIGPEGQRKLAGSSVLCVGTGGLGSPALLYLAAAGVGRIGLVDSDVVEESNLHRQVLFQTADVGSSKVESARRALAALNPEVELVTHEVRLRADNAEELLRGYDVIIDGTDNFPTRYLVNDTCVRLGKPDVWASVYRFEGQIAVFDARRGPCYRCFFRDEPPPDLAPSCAEAGVLGVLPGVLGTLQASEAIKLLLGIGEPLVGRVLLFDALSLSWNELALAKDPTCPVCGDAGRRAEGAPATPSIGIVAPPDLRARLEAGEALCLVDCREPFEWDICSLDGSLRIPLGDVPTRLHEIDRDLDVVVVCHHGPRSLQGASYLARQGYRRVSYLEGGLHAWSLQVDRSLPRY